MTTNQLAELTSQAYRLYFRLKSLHAEQSTYRQAFTKPIMDKAFKRYQRRLDTEYRVKQDNSSLPALAWTE